MFSLAIVMSMILFICGRSVFVSEIQDAVSRDDLEQVKLLIMKDPELIFNTDNQTQTTNVFQKAFSIEDYTPLHLAVVKEHLDIVEFFC